MKILVACEFSGIVREAFTKKGHDVWSCDLLDTEIPSEKHYKGDVMDILNQNWDMLIAHPPCTYLSNAGARFLYPSGNLNLERLRKGLHAKKLFMALYNLDETHGINKIVIENPIPSKAFELPDYDQIIQPYEHGYPFKKKTCLWVKGVPLLMPSKYIPPSEAESTKIAGNWFNKGGMDRQKNRAKTFQGIADAMADQWG